MGKVSVRVVLALVVVLAAGSAIADGTEALGVTSASLAGGTGMAVGGVGLIDVPQPQDIFVAVPQDAVVTQVLLYWIDEFYLQTAPDDTVVVNGVEVVGEPIGGPTNFFSVVYFETYRADITDLGLVGPGANTIEIDGLVNSFRTTGAGVLVVYDEAGADAELQLLDGLDLAYWRLAPPLDTTVPISFAFEAADYMRIAKVPVLVGSVGDARPNVTEFVVGSDVYRVPDLFTSLDGVEWDAQLIEVDIPAGVTSMSMQLLSESDGTPGNPASMAWCTAGLVLDPPEEGEEGEPSEEGEPGDCEECDGKVTWLTLEYLGGAAADVVVEQKKEGVVFSGPVAPGETFSFQGVDKKGTLGTEISIKVNGAPNTKIHTSCSRPIGPGLVSGDFLVVDGASLNGGLLCPLDTPDEGEPPSGECEECDGKVTWLTLEYLGGAAADVVVEQKKEGVVFSGPVAPGETFTFQGVDKKGTLGTEISIKVDGAPNTKIHTSCSRPIGPGLVSGDFLVVDGASRNGGLLCPLDPPDDDEGEPPSGDCEECDGKVTWLTLEYSGGAAANVVVEQKKEGVVFDGAVAPGEAFTFQGADKKGTLGTEISIKVDGAPNTKIHTSCSRPIGPGLVSGDFLVLDGASRNGGLLCPVDSPPEGPEEGEGDEGNMCDAGKPVMLAMVYTGEGCGASSHSQDPKKVKCDGDPAGEPLVYIVATDKKNPDDHRARIFFSGEVALGEMFHIDAANSDLTRLRAETHVFIYDMQGALLQSLEFHTSCSHPLFAGNQFGALELLGMLAESGDHKGTILVSEDGEVIDKGAVGCSGGIVPVRSAAGDMVLLSLMALALGAGTLRRAVKA